MNSTQKKVLSLLANRLFNTSVKVVVTKAIIDEAIIQAVSTLITKDYRTQAENIRVIAAHAELTKLLSDVPFTTFKGFVSAFYYPEASERPMGDVDFIVDSEYYDSTVKLLEDRGWKRQGDDHERHDSFRKDGIIYELHREIKGIPNGVDGIETNSRLAEETVRYLLSDLIESSVQVSTQQGEIVIPDEFHHGLIMILHIAGHMMNDGGVGLRHLCDWAVYVNSVNVSQFKSKFESAGLWTFVCQLTAVCSKFLGLPEQNWTGEWPDAFLQSVIEDILKSGNFGRKEAGRRATLALEHSSFAQVTRERYLMAKHPVLLPFFMVRNVIRYGVLIMLGKRKFIKPTTFSSAKKRDELYRKFQLFEISKESEKDMST